MKKFLSAVIACIICLCMFGCVSDEEKRLRQEQEWFDALTYDDFKLRMFYNWDTFVEYNFYILSSDSILTESIMIEFVSDEAQNLYMSGNYIPPYMLVIHKGERFDINARFGMEFLPKDKIPQNIPFTLHYTTTDGEEVSKDYILDFTQTPFWDYRTGTGLYKP